MDSKSFMVVTSLLSVKTKTRLKNTKHILTLCMPIILFNQFISLSLENIIRIYKYSTLVYYPFVSFFHSVVFIMLSTIVLLLGDSVKIVLLYESTRI